MFPGSPGAASQPSVFVPAFMMKPSSVCAPGSAPSPRMSPCVLIARYSIAPAGPMVSLYWCGVTAAAKDVRPIAPVRTMAPARPKDTYAPFLE
jgi:hypothetical protein